MAQEREAVSGRKQGRYHPAMPPLISRHRAAGMRCTGWRGGAWRAISRSAAPDAAQPEDLTDMEKHRGFPGRLPGTDIQFTIRRAAKEGPTKIIRRERFRDRRPPDRPSAPISRPSARRAWMAVRALAPAVTGAPFWRSAAR